MLKKIAAWRMRSALAIRLHAQAVVGTVRRVAEGTCQLIAIIGDVNRALTGRGGEFFARVMSRRLIEWGLLCRGNI
jgi:hypothetical protein